MLLKGSMKANTKVRCPDVGLQLPLGLVLLKKHLNRTVPSLSHKKLRGFSPIYRFEYYAVQFSRRSDTELNTAVAFCEVATVERLAAASADRNAQTRNA